MDVISKREVIAVIQSIAEMHPYKVVGDRESYDDYNQGWSDCASAIESAVDELRFNLTQNCVRNKSSNTDIR